MLATVYCSILTGTIANDESGSTPPKTSLYIRGPEAAIYPLILLNNEIQIVFVVYSRAIGVPNFNKGRVPGFPIEKKMV